VKLYPEKKWGGDVVLQFAITQLGIRGKGALDVAVVVIHCNVIHQPQQRVFEVVVNTSGVIPLFNDCCRGIGKGVVPPVVAKSIATTSVVNGVSFGEKLADDALKIRVAKLHDDVPL
jgi:hypothetical protein